MLLGEIFKICKLKKFCRADETKHLLFDYCFFIFFPHPQNFLKIGVYTHPIDLSCHQKFEKNFTDRKRKYWRTKLENMKIILVPRVHDPSGLWQGSRALAWSNTGSPRFTDFPSNLIGREYETNALRILRKSGPARRIVGSGDENV